MKLRWVGIFAVAIVVAVIIGLKVHRKPRPPIQTAQSVSSSKTEIILVANLSEANDKADNCSKIIHLVSKAGKDGIPVRELSPHSSSPLIRHYHVLTIPTLLVLHKGKVVSRYEGESQTTVQQIQTRLVQLEEGQP